ncbi:MAG: SpoIIE family protein phosphatase [Bacteroidia bacterium]|nr:SpoIIE family protein phosphatase [Bacteroidia bacterium]
MKNCLLLVLLFLMPKLGISTITKTDSLLKLVDSKKTNGIEEWKIFNELALSYIGNNYDSAKYYAQIGIEKANRLKNDTLVNISYQTLGILYSKSGEDQTAISILHQALKDPSNKLGTKRKGEIYRNLGNSFYHISVFDSSLTYYFNSLAEFKKGKHEKEAAGIFNNIGNVYYFNDAKTALKFYQKALDYYLDVEDYDGQAKGYGNLGLVYSRLHDYKKAVKFSQIALEKALLAKLSPLALSGYYVNLGYSYDELKEYDKAIENILIGLKIREEHKELKGIAVANCMLGSAYFDAKKWEQADSVLTIAVEQVRKMNLRSYQWEVLQTLSILNYRKGKEAKGDSLINLSNSIRDSVMLEEKQMAMNEMETKYETKEKDAKIQLLTQQGEIKDLYLIIAISAFLFLATLTLLIFFILRNNAKKNKLLEVQYKEISKQKKEITDSINYARKIQTALLPKESQVKQLMPKSFVYYKPKDIVSGDFYWIEKVSNNEILLAAVDCTGHGVPGAFMSVIGINLLNSALTEHNITHPSQILNFMNEGIKNALQKSQSIDNLKDGMDLALCKINFDTGRIQFAGANNPMVIIQDSKIALVKGDKLPIGGEFNQGKQYSNHEFTCKSGDRIYLFTDGFGDQFGGSEGKKFKKQRLLNLIESFQHLDLDQQIEKLDTEFNAWKGDQEQVDDVLVIGFQLA